MGVAKEISSVIRSETYVPGSERLLMPDPGFVVRGFTLGMLSQIRCAKELKIATGHQKVSVDVDFCHRRLEVQQKHMYMDY